MKQHRIKTLKGTLLSVAFSLAAAVTLTTAVAPQASAAEFYATRTCGSQSYPDKEYFPSLNGSNMSFHLGGFCLVRNQYMAIFQTDGNFVVYNNGRAVWATATYGRGASKLTFQSDGNLVIYAGNTPLWSSVTYGRMGPSNPNFPTLVMQTDGNLVIYGPNGRTPYWSTWTGPIFY